MRENDLKLLLSFLLIGLIGLQACKYKKTTDLKIMSYNIRHGVGMDTILDLSRAAKIIKSATPDFCALQEVDNFCSRSDSIGQTEYLAQQTSMTGTFGKFMNYQGGEYGMATLSVMPIISTEILTLPEGKYEPRTSIVQEVQITGKCTIAIANVHLDWIDDKEGSDNRLSQARALTKYLDALSRPTIITGDFNCTPDSPTMNYFIQKGFVFVEKGNEKLSFQGENKIEIDHTIYRNHGEITFKKKNVQLLPEPIVSDHRPLIVELEVTY